MQRSANISDEGRSTLENALFRTITLCIARTATAQAPARPASPPYHSRARAGLGQEPEPRSCGVSPLDTSRVSI